MIRRLKLTNFRNHADTLLHLQPLTLLVGPAGAGKSNLFKALVLLQNTVHSSLPELFPPGLGEFPLVRSRFAAETDPIRFEVELSDLPELPGEQAQYTLSIAEAPAGLYVLEETLARRAGEEPWEWVVRRSSKRRLIAGFGEIDPHTSPTLLNRAFHGGPDVEKSAPQVLFVKKVAQALSQFGYFHLDLSNLGSLGTGQPVDQIDYYGGRLPDFLAWARSEEEGKAIFATIVEELRGILPDLTDLILTRSDKGRQGIGLTFAGHRGYIAAPDLSDGTLLTLGLLCILHSPRKPHVLCLEEPENGLHPRRLRWLFDRLVALSFPPPGHPPVQILLTTHSPYVVDFFRDMQDAVQVVEQRDGRARVSSLSEIQAKLHNDGKAQGIGHAWATGLFEGLWQLTEQVHAAQPAILEDRAGA